MERVETIKSLKKSGLSIAEIRKKIAKQS
ncbi:hypothetical protein [Peribacillus simplex]